MDVHTKVDRQDTKSPTNELITKQENVPITTSDFGAIFQSRTPKPERVLQLQRIVGNARTLQLLRQRPIQRVDDPPNGVMTPTDSGTPTTAPTETSSTTPSTSGGTTSTTTGETTGTTTPTPETTTAQPTERWTEADQQMLDAAVAQVGIIEQYQAGQVPQAVRVLSQENYDAFRQLLTSAGADLERAFLCKALAAARSISDITRFAERIRGRSERWLRRNLTLINWTGGGGGITQQYSDSCAPTTVQAFHGLYDPIYALYIRSSGNIAQQPGNAQSNPGSVSNQRMLGEQGRMLTNNGGAMADRATGGGTGVNDGPWAGLINQFSRMTGLRYRPKYIPGDLSWNRAFSILNTNLDQGIHIPAGVSGATGGHAVLIIQRDGNRYQIHDPWTGQTVWRRRSAFVGNTLNLPSGWNTMDMIMVPRRVQARSTREPAAPTP